MASNNRATVTSFDSDEAGVHTDIDWLRGHMPLFDSRIYRKLNLVVKSKTNSQEYTNLFYPHFDYGSWVMDFNETPSSIQNFIEQTNDEKQKEALRNRQIDVSTFIEKHKNEYLASRSFIHPYALVKLAGACGSYKAVAPALTFDYFAHRKFYEIDGDEGFSGNYSKTPTTTTLIRWGNDSPKNKTPYAFQDFVFCKWWNKIENNRLITLRRYAAPVTDNIEFADYDVEESTDDDSFTVSNGSQDNSKKTKYKGTHSNNPWQPLATAVTYFGDETGNKISDILAFTAGYNWTELGKDRRNPIQISSSQNDAGSGLVGNTFSGVSGILGDISKFMGFMGEVHNGMTINLDAGHNQPPDPYAQGPYENRILGPVNVIMDTYKRERGLNFKQENLNIKFEYVARPIAGINNKAVMLDLLANMLLLTYSSGSWFGGMWKYRTGGPALYPFKYGDSMNKLYKGQIFGSDGAVMSLTKHAFSEGPSYLAAFLPDAMDMLGGIFSGLKQMLSWAAGKITGKDDEKSAEEKKDEARRKFDEAFNTGTGKAIQKVIAAKAMKGATVPYIEGQRALLTGDPIGDWHLTIGNPLNPIAMIGNLIVKDVNIKFSDELGPDDFPIGFEATVKLAHGLGRDKDAIESMFNRGFGRIYSLSSEFRSSADGETKVDNATGTNGEERMGYDETRNTYFGGGTRFIAAVQKSKLANSGSIYGGDTLQLKSLSPTNVNQTQAIATYEVNPWQMGYTL